MSEWDSLQIDIDMETRGIRYLEEYDCYSKELFREGKVGLREIRVNKTIGRN